MSTKTTKTKARGDGIGAYKLLLLLMYGDHKWIERDGANIRIPCAKLASHFRTSANRIQDRLYLLEDMQCLNMVRWNRYWATVQVRPPKNMGYMIECDNNMDFEVIDVKG